MIRILNFIPIEGFNTIILFNDLQNGFIDIYEASIEIAQKLDLNVTFNYGEYYYIVNKDTTIEDINKQYKYLNEINYSLCVEEKIQSIIENIDINNIKNKLNEITKLMNFDNEKQKSITSYQLNELSKILFNLYKSTLPDSYFDNIIEQVKILKK